MQQCGDPWDCLGLACDSLGDLDCIRRSRLLKSADDNTRLIRQPKTENSVAVCTARVAKYPVWIQAVFDWGAAAVNESLRLKSPFEILGLSFFLDPSRLLKPPSH